MAKKKRFRVEAEFITYGFIIVEAETSEQANEIAENTDGGDFVTIDNEGDFNILSTATRVATKEDLESEFKSEEYTIDEDEDEDEFTAKEDEDE